MTILEIRQNSAFKEIKLFCLNLFDFGHGHADLKYNNQYATYAKFANLQNMQKFQNMHNMQNLQNFQPIYVKYAKHENIQNATFTKTLIKYTKFSK